MQGALRTDITSGVALVHRKGRHHQQRQNIGHIQDTLDYTSGDEARQLQYVLANPEFQSPKDAKGRE